MKYDLFASPVLEFNVLSHIQVNGVRNANQSIHKSLEKALFRSGERQACGFYLSFPTYPNLNLYNGNKTALVLTKQLTSMHNICFGPEDTIRV